MCVGYRRLYRTTAEINEGSKQIQKHVHTNEVHTKISRKYTFYGEIASELCVCVCMYTDNFFFVYSLLKSSHSVGTPHVYYRHTYTFAITSMTHQHKQFYFIFLLFFLHLTFIHVFIPCILILIYIKPFSTCFDILLFRFFVFLFTLNWCRYLFSLSFFCPCLLFVHSFVQSFVSFVLFGVFCLFNIRKFCSMRECVSFFFCSLCRFRGYTMKSTQHESTEAV